MPGIRRRHAGACSCCGLEALGGWAFSWGSWRKTGGALNTGGAATPASHILASPADRSDDGKGGGVAQQIGKRGNRLRVGPLKHPLCPHQMLFDSCLVDPSSYSFKRKLGRRSGPYPRSTIRCLGTHPRNPLEVPDNALAVHDGLGGLAGLAAGLQCLDTSLRRLARNSTPRVLSMKSSAPRSKASFSFASWAWLVRNTTGKLRRAGAVLAAGRCPKYPEASSRGR